MTNTNTKTLTATYDSKAALSNVVDDLVNDGLPRETIYSDDEAMEVKVIVADAIVPQVTATLKRHDPTAIT